MNGELNQSVGLPESTRARLEQEMVKQEAAKQANSMPLPGPLAEAFPPANVKYGKFVVRPMTASDMAVLQKVGSPFCSLSSSPDLTFTAEDMVVAVYVFTNPSRVSYEKLKDGKQALIDEAMAVIGELHPDDLAKMFSVIGTKVPQTFEAAISYGAAEKNDEDKAEVVNFPASNP